MRVERYPKVFGTSALRAQIRRLPEEPRLQVCPPPCAAPARGCSCVRPRVVRRSGHRTLDESQEGLMQPDFQQILISSVQHGMRSWADAKWGSEPAGASSLNQTVLSMILSIDKNASNSAKGMRHTTLGTSAVCSRRRLSLGAPAGTGLSPSITRRRRSSTTTGSQRAQPRAHAATRMPGRTTHSIPRMRSGGIGLFSPSKHHTEFLLGRPFNARSRR